MGHICASEGPSDVAKDAEQRAAFAALKGLGYLDKKLEYKNMSHQNKPQQNAGDNLGTHQNAGNNFGKQQECSGYSNQC